MKRWFHNQYFDVIYLWNKGFHNVFSFQIPYFIEGLNITEVVLGNEMPVIRKASRPYFDENGFWIDLAVNYGGGARMTIETKANLMKLKDPVAGKDKVEKVKTKK